MTTEYMIPQTDQFIETVAMAIARNRIIQDARTTISPLQSQVPDIFDKVEDVLNDTFDSIWAADSSEAHRNIFREDAKAAISAINLKLLTMEE